MTPDLTLCAQEVRNNDHDQFLCSLFAPEKQRQAIFALHVFYMETARIRSLVNEPHLGLIRLQWWRDIVESALNGTEDGSHNGTHKEFVLSLKNSSIPVSLFDSYFSARAFDMEDRAPDRVKSLTEYCKNTGGSLAQMKCHILGASDEQTISAAQSLGAAATLCSLLKTLPYQSRSGRTMLPKDIVQKHNLDIKSFFEFSSSEPLNACVKDLVGEVENLLKDARTSLTQTKENVPAVMLVSVSIEDYLSRLKKIDFDPFNPNIGGGRLSKQLKLAYRAWRKKY